MLKTPVALFVFNRPEKTGKVLEQISLAEPETLLVVADGPRESVPADEVRCAEVRQRVRDAVDWGCDLRWNTASENLGLKQRFVTGLEWVFSEVDEAIILEDDCLPNESFFEFCSVMLEKFRGDDRVMDVTGTNFLGDWKSETQDYHFSLYGGIWGWATWKDSLEWYDPDMELWAEPDVKQRVRDVIADDAQADYLEYIYDKTHSGELETWDYPWGFARHIQSTLSVVPAKNLVTNIGFDAQATNTDEYDSEMSDLPTHDLCFPIEHPEYVAVDREYDRRFHQMRPLTHRVGVLRYLRELIP